MLPVGLMLLALAPFTGWFVGRRGSRLSLVIAGAALVLAGAGLVWVAPTTPLPMVLALYALFGAAIGAGNPPIAVTAISGMPRSMAGVATSLASTGRQTGTTLSIAVAATIAGSALSQGGTTAQHRQRSARRAATLFDDLDAGTTVNQDRGAEVVARRPR